MRIIYLALLIALPALAEGEPAAHFSCAYKFMGTDFAGVALGILPDGSTEDFVTVTHYGKSQRASCTHMPLAKGEMMHFWISKESKDNSIEVIVFEEARKEGKSVMINPHIPLGREMWGECRLDPVKP